jgi:hypothetical protein
MGTQLATVPLDTQRVPAAQRTVAHASPGSMQRGRPSTISQRVP